MTDMYEYFFSSSIEHLPVDWSSYSKGSDSCDINLFEKK